MSDKSIFDGWLANLKKELFYPVINDKSSNWNLFESVLESGYIFYNCFTIESNYGSLIYFRDKSNSYLNLIDVKGILYEFTYWSIFFIERG